MKWEQKISVLNILTTIDDGGLEMLVYRIYKGLSNNGYNLNLVSLTPLKRNFLEIQFEELGVKIIPFDFRNKGKGIFDAIHNTIQFVRFIIFLWNTEFDIIHSHDFFPAFVARFGMLMSLKKILRPRLKIFTTYHNVYYWLKPFHHRINKLLSVITEKIVCVSNTVRNTYVIQEKIRADKFEVIRNGVNEQQFFPDEILRTETREELGYSRVDFVIGCVAVLTERKGQIYLVEAFRKLAENFPYARLLLVGGSREHETDYYEALEQMVKKYSLEGLVRFHPPVKSVNPIYNAIDLFVLPSITEGFGLSAFECMLTEKICLFSDLNVFKELTLDGEFGYHFEVKNSQSLYEKLEYIIKNFAILSVKVKEYRKFVVNNYSEKVMVNRYDKMYRNLMK